MKKGILSIFVIVFLIANIVVVADPIVNNISRSNFENIQFYESYANINLEIKHMKSKYTTGFIEWESLFDSGYDDMGRCIQPTQDGGYIIVGHGYGYRVLMLKIDGNGNTQWETQFKNKHPDYCWYVLQTEDGGFLVLAETKVGGNHVWLIKTDENGTKVWDKFLGYKAQSACRCIQPTRDGGYILAGYTSPDSWLWSYDTWLLKIDSEGFEEWNRTFERPHYNRAFYVSQTSDDGFIITGLICQTQQDYSDLWLIKTDEKGYMQWNKIYGELKPAELGKCVQQTTDGGYIITGETQEPAGNFLIKTDGKGEIIWSKPYGGISVQQTSDGGYITTGCISYNFRPWWGYQDLLLVKTDSNGKMRWCQIYGEKYNDVGNFVMQTEDGGYIIAGTKQHEINGYLAGSDFWIIKTSDKPGFGMNLLMTFKLLINQIISNQIKKIFYD
jgi:hypothetical protein